MICGECHYVFPTEEGIKDLFDLRSFRRKSRIGSSLVICPRCFNHMHHTWYCDIRVAIAETRQRIKEESA